MLRLVLAISLVLSGLSAQAQLGERVRGLLVGDTAAPPDHDTAYIVSYRDRLMISAVTNFRNVDIDIEGDAGRTLSFTTNSAAQYGLALDYKWLSAEATFNVPAWSASVPGLGSTTSRGFGLGLTGRRLWARAFWNRTQGFYLQDPQAWVPGWVPGNLVPVRGDLVNNTVLASVNFALSGKRRYSQNAAQFQVERQKKSAGTFVVGASAWSTDVRADSALLTAAQTDTFDIAERFSRVRRGLLGVAFGYTHTFAFWHRGFIHFAVLPGIGYQYRSTQGADGTGQKGGSAASVTELRASLGYNAPIWYTALSLAYYYSTGALNERIGLGTTYGSVRLAMGVRFGAPRVRGAERYGL